MKTSKKIIIVLLVLFVFKMPVLSQEKSEMQEKLNFLVGEWKSVSVNQATGEESTGNSSIQWVMDGAWLQWKYVGQLEQGTLEVFTLINYHGEKKQYAFYSFNPFDEEPLPHYGNWLDANTLRLEITSQGEKTWVDFKIKENGDFDQEHSSINASGERVNTRKTSYSSACVYQDKFSKLRGPYLGQTPPGMTPEIFAPDIISSSDFLEYCLTFSSDGKEIYFNRSGAGVFVCRLKDKGWSDPEKPEFAKRYKVGEAHITPDGKRMLVNRYRGLNEGEQGGIWEFHRIKDDWSNPKFLIPFGMRATTTFDGTIYTTDISGYKKENEDGGIIACFSVSRKGYQRNTDPGGGVNTESLDSHPFIDPKERYIIFDSDRPGGMGKSDLYVCFKNSDGSWGDAINIRELNSTEGDWCATVSPDGKYLFYTSNIDQNIHWVDAKIIEAFTSAYEGAPLFSQDIYEAAWTGNLDRVKALIKENPALLHIKSPEGYNPLHVATTYNRKKVVKFLIEAGADKNVANLWGKTPFHRAAEKGYLEIVEILLEAGTDINIEDKKGWTPLRWAVSSGQKEVTELLLKRGAEFNFNQSDYDRLLHEAAGSSYEKFVNIILDKEADIYSLNNRGGTLLHSAAFGGLKNLAELMVKKDFNIEAKNYYGMTPLHIAAFKGNKDVVEFLIEKNAEVNAADFGRRTPLQYAENEEHKIIINFLASKGAETTPGRAPVLKGKYFGLEKPGLFPEIFVPGIISTIDGFEFAGTFSPDGKEFFFTYRKPGVQDNCIKYTKQENGIWCSPEFAPFSSTFREVEPHISPDGKKLYFNSRRPLPGKKVENNNRDVWVVKKNKEEWGEPQFLGSPVCEEIAMYVTETDDGTIYFTGNRDRGIYKSAFNNNKFSMPERLPDEINYLHNAGHPYIAPDESYIILDGRDERKNSDDTDLYVSFRKSDGSWAKAINMGSPINSDVNEICASVSPDGKYLFFQSGRTGNMDIYWMDAKIIEELKPDELK